MAIPAEDSLYHVLRNVIAPRITSPPKDTKADKSQRPPKTAADRFAKSLRLVAAISQPQAGTIDYERYGKLVERKAEKGNEPILQLIFDFAQGTWGETPFSLAWKNYLQLKVFGTGTPQFEIFKDRVLQAMGQVVRQLADNIELFTFKSFPQTYFHASIAKALAAEGNLTDPAKVRDRITATGLLVLTAASAENGLAVMLAVAASHYVGRPGLGNTFFKDTIEFTLLTFSLYGGEVIHPDDHANWFLFWKIFGSMMGLPYDRLHDNLGAAREAMNVRDRQCNDPMPGSQGAALLDAFIEAMMRRNAEGQVEGTVEEKIQEFQGQNFITPRMETYLRSKNLWPK